MSPARRNDYKALASVYFQRGRRVAAERPNVRIMSSLLERLAAWVDRFVRLVP
jgi:hypothetical protein